MQRTVVIDVVGLTPELVGEHTPALSRLAWQGDWRHVHSMLPAVTCPPQATYLTGKWPREHGIVGNGWYFRDLSQVWLWRQSNRLVQAEKVWETARRRDPDFTCAKLFWWFNMYSSVDWSVTPRPMYPSDGRKIPDVYTQPGELRGELNARLGQFPLFKFWGPNADLTSSRWIVDCARHVFDTRRPTLTLVYLPHLDYDLQKFGPGEPHVAKQLRAIDGLCEELIDHVQRAGARVVVLSEYGIVPVQGPVHINRALRREGLLTVREELGRDQLLDAGASEAFALADHQVAHVYVARRERIPEVKALLEGLDGVEMVLDDEGKRAYGLDHERAGELVAVTRSDRWFTYYYWLDEDRAPDFAHTVDIHGKPGYDPVEMFFDERLRFPKAAVAWRLLKKWAGQRTLMDVISTNPALVKGSHGRIPDQLDQGPLLMTDTPELLPEGAVEPPDVRDLMLRHVFE